MNSCPIVGFGRLVRGAALVAGLVLVAGARGQTFSNTAAVNIVDLGAASPYPSPITVSGVVGTIERVSVSISGFSHTYPGDVSMVLVAPSGQGVALMGSCGGATDAVNAAITFSDSASALLPAQIVSGTYLPSNCYGTVVPPPAPQSGNFADLAVLQGQNPNGVWKLYVADNAAGDAGQIAGGWSITFSTQPTSPTATAFTYQGILNDNGAPLTGSVDARFRLYTTQSGSMRIGPPLHQTVSVTDGLLSTWLDFGDVPLSVSDARWLEVTINGQMQSPRQRLMNAPTATKSLFAESAATAATATTATNATSAQSVAWSGITGVPANVSNAFSPWTLNGSNIQYSAGAVAIGTPNFTSKFNIASTEGNTSYQTSASQYGTYAIIHNDTAGNYWQFIATGTGNSGGANDLIIANSVVPGTASSNVIRLTSGNYMGIGLPVGTLPSQRLTVNGNVLANNVAVPSSIRFKDHVVPMDDALNKVMKLEGVRFDWKPEWAKERPGREHDIGFVAEDVAKVFPEVVFYDTDGNVTGMDYSRLTAVAIEAIKQQQAQLATQQTTFSLELAKRDAENAELRARLERLEKALAK